MNRFKTLFASSFVVVILFFNLMHAQSRTPANNRKESLNNDKVIALVNIGLSDTVIIEKIRQSDCDFDTSTSALANLKAAKVSDGIILAMINPKTGSVESASVNPLANQDPGIYAIQADSLVEIDPTAFSGAKANMLVAMATWGIKKTAVKGVLRGATAGNSINGKRPEFYFYFSEFNAQIDGTDTVFKGFMPFGASNPGEFLLVKLDQKSDTRETVMGEVGITGSKIGPRDKDTIPFSFEKISKRVFKVVPKIDLKPGEYGFWFAGGTHTGENISSERLFDFTVKD